jgi:ATP-dependent DNA helicase RecG
MQPSLVQLQKYLQLEQARNFDNGAVMGGLARILASWEKAAQSEGVPVGQLQSIIHEIQAYEQIPMDGRKASIDRIYKLIAKPSGTKTAEPTPSVSKSKQISRSVTATSTKIAAESVPEALAAPVHILDGVGPKSAERLAKLDLLTLEDMLFHTPRRYEDYSQLLPIAEVTFGQSVSVAGVVRSKSKRQSGKRKLKIYELLIEDDSGSIRASWFNQPWRTKNLKEGDRVLLSGQADQYLGRLLLSNPEIEQLDGDHINTQRIVPFYPLTAEVGQRWLRKLMHSVIHHWAPRIGDAIPSRWLDQQGLVDISEALLNIHFPQSEEALKAAQLRLAFGEMLLLQLNVLQKRTKKQSLKARKFPLDQDWHDRQFAQIPFVLTAAQQRAWSEMQSDFESGRPMTRLLQGDVGSGKTVVAALGASAVIARGAQAAIMAPTSILAEQHFQNLRELLVADQLLLSSEIALLQGSTPKAEKERILKELALGHIKLLIGTHALIEKTVVFQDLQFIVIDEQHRFGVGQRAALRAKGKSPHVLVMTATPIPRSLALSIYGDLDLSIIYELPPGRKAVQTQIMQPRERPKAHKLVLRELAEGRQAFIIYPLVEGSESKAEKAAVQQSLALQKGVFTEWKVALLHGRLKADEKEQIMAKFREGKTNVLVSTSVIEVGVDIPNASVMLVEGADSFGLAQLHQFRGRVGRGTDSSYCILIPETESDFENERLEAMVETNDGFKLADYDLKQRGPGEFLGKRQSGYSSLRFASLTDSRMINEARVLATEILKTDPGLNESENLALTNSVRAFSEREAGEIS